MFIVLSEESGNQDLHKIHENIIIQLEFSLILSNYLTYIPVFIFNT